MKILHIHPSYKMSKKFVYPLMQKEKSLGYESTIINFKKNEYSNNINFDLRINNLGLLYESMRFIYFILKKKPDLVFCHNSLQSFIPLILTRLLKVNKVIYFNHGISFLGYRGIKRLILYIIEKINLLFAHKTLTVSKEMKFYLDKIGHNISIIKNGSACGIIIENKKIKKNFNFSKKRKLTISYIGRLELRKGSRVLIKLLEFFKNTKKIKFVFCGFDEEEFIKHSGKKFQNLNCLGFIDNVNKVLENCDILLLPSLHEGMPYSILEAMSKSVLVIANDIPGIRSLIKDGYNGYLIRNNNADLYISLITSLMNKEINVKRLIYNNFEIIEKYNRSIFMLNYANFLKRV